MSTMIYRSYRTQRPESADLPPSGHAGCVALGGFDMHICRSERLLLDQSAIVTIKSASFQLCARHIFFLSFSIHNLKRDSDSVSQQSQRETARKGRNTMADIACRSGSGSVGSGHRSLSGTSQHEWAWAMAGRHRAAAAQMPRAYLLENPPASVQQQYRGGSEEMK
eukprot:6197635-Pleurochrysis_carterae.AAC.1